MGRGSRSGGGRSSFGGGGGRSSFSSGGRSSRSSFGGHSSHGFGGHSHHHTVYIGPRRHRHHHYYGGYGYGGGVSVNPLYAILAFFIFFTAVAGFAIGGNIAYEEESVEIAISDYNFYQDLITNAENKGYIVTGTVVNEYYDYEVGKWWLDYKVPGSNQIYETFSVYTDEQVRHISPDDPIQIALDRKVMSSLAENIDVNFKYVELEDFSLYILANESLTYLKTVRTVCLTICGALVAILVVAIVKGVKKGEETSSVSSSSTTSRPVSSSSTCRYCGTVHESGTKKCNNCGAQLK